MQTDPVEEWRRLTALYAEMGDVEIEELAAQIGDLTQTAKKILRDEMKKRGISEDRLSQSAGSNAGVYSGVHRDDREDSYRSLDAETDVGGTSSFTWKTGLCRCESIHEAAQRGEMLRRAGIESWVQRPGARFVVPWISEPGVGDIQLNVAADQLDEARAVVSQPVPPDIIALLEEQDATPPYELPRCPGCKAEDPTLESAERSNNWLCETCGYAWSDPLPASGEGAGEAESEN
jgi:hypothetical protein